MKGLNLFKDLLHSLLGAPACFGDLHNRGLEEACVIDVPDDELRDARLGTHDVVGGNLLEEVLLEGLFFDKRIEEKLPLLVVFIGAAGVAGALRHVIAPLLVELGQALKLLLEFVVLLLTILDGRLHRLLFKRRVGLNLLLDNVAQLQHWRLKDHQTLLQLRR